MNYRVLCVDDEDWELTLYKTQLREFDITVAQSGEAGLIAIKNDGPFSVIVSDLRMPKMNGTQFLARAREMTPNGVRMVMSGETDVVSMSVAINDGNLFRFLIKPCPTEVFCCAIRAGIEQHRLITAEKELLEKTLCGSIEVLTEILSLVSPLAFGKATRIRRLVQQLGSVIKVGNPWLLEVAAMLSQIGCVTIPDAILSKLYSRSVLTIEERGLFATHPKVGRDLVRKIPRLEEVAEIIFYQDRHYDSSCTLNGEKTSDAPLGARILKVAIDCEELESHGCSREAAIVILSERNGWYAPEVLKALNRIPFDEAAFSRDVVLVRRLQKEMILDEDLKNRAGALLAPKGQTISGPMLRRLLNNASQGNVCDRIKVLVPKTISAFVP